MSSMKKQSQSSLVRSTILSFNNIFGQTKKVGSEVLLMIGEKELLPNILAGNVKQNLIKQFP
jgi:hypothetical protein